MPELSPTAYAIAPYRPADRQAVREICVACAWLGAPAPERIGDPVLWAEFWTRYFTDREGRHCWVVRGPDRIPAGYLTGTADVRRVQRYEPWLAGPIAWRVLRGRLLRRAGCRRAMRAMLRSLGAGEMDLPPGVATEYPATCHVNLLPAARGRGLGAKLLKAFRDRMASLGVRGMHVQILSVNRAAAGLFGKAGFHRVASRPTRAFAHVDPAPLAVETWVRRGR